MKRCVMWGWWMKTRWGWSDEGSKICSIEETVTMVEVWSRVMLCHEDKLKSSVMIFGWWIDWSRDRWRWVSYPSFPDILLSLLLYSFFYSSSKICFLSSFWCESAWFFLLMNIRRSFLFWLPIFYEPIWFNKHASFLCGCRVIVWLRILQNFELWGCLLHEIYFLFAADFVSNRKWQVRLYFSCEILRICSVQVFLVCCKFQFTCDFYVEFWLDFVEMRFEVHGANMNGERNSKIWIWNFLCFFSYSNVIDVTWLMDWTWTCNFLWMNIWM